MTAFTQTASSQSQASRSVSCSCSRSSSWPSPDAEDGAFRNRLPPDHSSRRFSHQADREVLRLSRGRISNAFSVLASPSHARLSWPSHLPRYAVRGAATKKWGRWQPLPRAIRTEPSAPYLTSQQLGVEPPRGPDEWVGSARPQALSIFNLSSEDFFAMARRSARYVDIICGSSRRRFLIMAGSRPQPSSPPDLQSRCGPRLLRT